MLNLFKRKRPTAQPYGYDPLKIRDLLDDPRLQAVMSTPTVETVPVSADRRDQPQLIGSPA